MLGKAIKLLTWKKDSQTIACNILQNSEQTELNITIVFIYSPLNTSNDQIMTLCAVPHSYFINTSY